MSYWIYLTDENGVCETTPHEYGAVKPVGLTSECVLNVSYNYSECYRLVSMEPYHLPHDPEHDEPMKVFSLRWLDAKTSKDTQITLQKVIDILGDHPYKADHLAPTPGNAGNACAILLKWSQEHPEGRWEVH